MKPDNQHKKSRPARPGGDASAGVTMEQRAPGRTGVSVSKLCLGTMMFGDWGTRTTTRASGSSG
jgi:hypothetical protein